MKYGPIKTPEEQSRIEVFENPVETLKALYAQWRIATKHMLRVTSLGQYVAPLEDIGPSYAQGAALLKPYSGWNPRLTEDMLREALAPNQSGCDIFLNALLNYTGIDSVVLEHWPPISLLGYRLKPGKFVALGPKIAGSYFAYNAEGGTSLDLCNIERAEGPTNATGGVHLSKKHAMINPNGTGGMHIIFEEPRHYGPDPTNGLLSIRCVVDEIRYDVRWNGTCVQHNLNRYYGFYKQRKGTSVRRSNKCEIQDDTPEEQPLLNVGKQLTDRISTLSPIARQIINAAPGIEKLVTDVRAFDFHSFERDIKDLFKHVEELMQ